ncbi:MOSC domain-containing protein [Chryseolinea sp. T2]|uniref:MOSC domain-containing protein n=1 Tax=Chryseolinea sp. T2 TaxID=3129255 RepID=UPI003077A16A
MEIKELMKTFRQDGLVERITVRPERRANVVELNNVEAAAGLGLQGDRYKGRGGVRQVTLIQAEHLSAVASILGVESIDFTLTRRNILVSGINLLSLKDKDFRLGEAVLRYSGDCHPCSRMEEAFGPGAYNAMRGHGGITAKVIQSGRISVGDRLTPIVTEDTEVKSQD